MVKLCRKCGLLKEHHRHTRSKDGMQYWCADCRKGWKPVEKAAYDKAHYHQDKEKYRNSSYKKRYGITLADYNKLLLTQNGLCGICNSMCSSGKLLAVDHNHKTNKVRGLLCTKCNLLIGYASESPEILRQAIEYLRRKYG